MWPCGGAKSSAAPLQYTDDLGGYERMLRKHLNLGITEQQRFRFTTLMCSAADDAGMPDDPEFRSALVAYLEWGTRIALGNSQHGATVMEHAPVPRWGWERHLPISPRSNPKAIGVACDVTTVPSGARTKNRGRPTPPW